MFRLGSPRSHAAVAILLVTSCGQRLSVAECERLLDHYTERLIRSESPSTPAAKVSEKQSLARRLAKTDPAFEFDACSEQVTRRQFKCAMAADNVDTIEKCLML